MKCCASKRIFTIYRAEARHRQRVFSLTLFVSFFNYFVFLYIQHILPSFISQFLQYILFSSFWSTLSAVRCSFLQVSGRITILPLLQFLLFLDSDFPQSQLAIFFSFTVLISTHAVCIHTVTYQASYFKYQARPCYQKIFVRILFVVLLLKAKRLLRQLLFHR